MRIRWASFNRMTWSRHSRRIEPIRRSTDGFCQGDRGAITTSSMSVCLMGWRKRVADVEEFKALRDDPEFQRLVGGST